MTNKNISINKDIIERKGGVVILDLEKYKKLNEILEEYKRKKKVIGEFGKF